MISSPLIHRILFRSFFSLYLAEIVLPAASWVSSRLVWRMGHHWHKGWLSILLLWILLNELSLYHSWLAGMMVTLILLLALILAHHIIIITTVIILLMLQHCWRRNIGRWCKSISHLRIEKGSIHRRFKGVVGDAVPCMRFSWRRRRLLRTGSRIIHER